MKRTHLLYLVIGLYVLSLFLPAFYVETRSGVEAVNSGYCLMAGWMVALGAGVGLSWLANPFFLSSLLFAPSKYKWQLGLALIGLFWSLYFLLFGECMTSSQGTMHRIETLGLGYYFWVLSQVFWIAGILYFKWKKSTI